MVSDLDRMAAEVHGAADYRKIFTDIGDMAGIRKVYRHYARVLYPDVYPDPKDKKKAAKAFERFDEMRVEAEAALARGSSKFLLTVTTPRCTHELIQLIPGGDLCDVFESFSHPKGGGDLASFAKVARQPGDNDLLQAEAAAIRHLRGDGSDPAHHPFFPELIDSFAYGERGQPARQINVLAQLGGFYNLEQVKRAYPAGLIALDMAWMWRRLLYALGAAHRRSIVHGAVLPSHVMVLPEHHGLILTDWCYASRATDDGSYPPIKAIVESYRQSYPAEVLAKQPPDASTDIMMAARCMLWLTRDDIPKPFLAFFNGCLSSRQSARPSDAWELLQEFDELLERLGGPYFPRRFRPFTMPSGVV